MGDRFNWFIMINKTSYDAILIKNSYSSEKYSFSLNSWSHWKIKMVFRQHTEEQALIGERVIIATKWKNSVGKISYHTFLRGKWKVTFAFKFKEKMVLYVSFARDISEQ